MKEGGCSENLGGCGLFFCLIVAVACGVIGCEDVRYDFSETKPAEAQFQEYKEVWQRRGRGKSSDKYVVYKFKDHKGERQKGWDQVHKSWYAPEDGKLAIEYMPGKIESGTKFTVSRLKGSGGFICKYLFYAGVVGAVICGIVAAVFTKKKED